MAEKESNWLHQSPEGIEKPKKRRLHGACDACRKRKSDSAIAPGNVCSNCKMLNIPCTHEAPGPPGKKETRRAYIESLEVRLVKMERVLRTLYPDTDIESLLALPISEVAKSFSSASDTTMTGASVKSIPGLKYPTPYLSATLSSNAPSPESPVDSEEEEEELSRAELTAQFFPKEERFFGQSSSYMFAHCTMHARGQHFSYSVDSRRPLYWEMRPWELSFARSQQPTLVYPEPNLLNSLIALYFDRSNIFIPVLHKPTFLRSLTAGLHHRDFGFGMTVLLVCAIASRFTSDPRVLLDDDISSLSAGWQYYTQVPVFRSRLFENTTLYDLQCYVLSTVYLLGASMIHVAWPMVGLGLRFAQEKGLHRRKGRQEHTIENESEKRVFWSLIVIDRWMSAFLGRPCGMQDEEFDLDYPIECDDEYWETPNPKDAFRQPLGKPSKIAYFLWTIKLAEILGYTLRTLYSTKKSKAIIGLLGREWESQAVAELDSSMNKWKDSLPQFLYWNPENQDTTFFWQSIALHTCFYHLQMQIHRPFLMKQNPLSSTSLVICNNAARSTAHVLEVAMSRGAAVFPSVYMSAFTAASVLLLTQWVYQNADSGLDVKTTTELVRKLFNILKDGERRWHMAGRLCDLTQILGCLSDHRSNSQLKRRRQSSGIVDPHLPQSQSNGGEVWGSQTGLAGERLQEGVSAKFESSAGHIMDQPDVGINTDPVSFLCADADFLASLSSQDGGVGLLDLGLNAQNLGLDASNDLFKMWANVPLNFSSYEWADFLSDAMQNCSEASSSQHI